MQGKECLLQAAAGGITNSTMGVYLHQQHTHQHGSRHWLMVLHHSPGVCVVGRRVGC